MPKAVLVPYPVAGMTCWPVSKRVGTVKKQRPERGRARLIGRC